MEETPGSRGRWILGIASRLHPLIVRRFLTSILASCSKSVPLHVVLFVQEADLAPLEDVKRVLADGGRWDSSWASIQFVQIPGGRNPFPGTPHRDRFAGHETEGCANIWHWFGMFHAFLSAPAGVHLSGS